MKNFIKLYSSFLISKPAYCCRSNALWRLFVYNVYNTVIVQTEKKRYEIFRNPNKNVQVLPKRCKKGWNKGWWFNNVMKVRAFAHISGLKICILNTRYISGTGHYNVKLFFSLAFSTLGCLLQYMLFSWLFSYLTWDIFLEELFYYAFFKDFNFLQFLFYLTEYIRKFYSLI